MPLTLSRIFGLYKVCDFQHNPLLPTSSGRVRVREAVHVNGVDSQENVFLKGKNDTVNRLHEWLVDCQIERGTVNTER